MNPEELLPIHNGLIEMNHNRPVLDIIYQEKQNRYSDREDGLR